MLRPGVWHIEYWYLKLDTLYVATSSLTHYMLRPVVWHIICHQTYRRHITTYCPISRRHHFFFNSYQWRQDSWTLPNLFYLILSYQPNNYNLNIILYSRWVMKKCGTAQPRASGWDVVESCNTFSWNSFHNPASSGRSQHLTFAAFQTTWTFVACKCPQKQSSGL